jgi:hypothetical protein
MFGRLPTGFTVHSIVGHSATKKIRGFRPAPVFRARQADFAGSPPMSGIIWYDETFSITCVVSSRESFLSTAAFSETRVLPPWWSAADQRPPSPSSQNSGEASPVKTGRRKVMRMRKPFERFLSHRPLMFGTEVMRTCLHLLLPKIFPEYCRSGGSEAGPEGNPFNKPGLPPEKGGKLARGTAG